MNVRQQGERAELWAELPCASPSRTNWPSSCTSTWRSRAPASRARWRAGGREAPRWAGARGSRSWRRRGAGAGSTHRGEPQAVAEHQPRQQRHLAGRRDGVQVQVRDQVERRPVEPHPGPRHRTQTHTRGRGVRVEQLGTDSATQILGIWIICDWILNIFQNFTTFSYRGNPNFWLPHNCWPLLYQK